MKLRHCIVILVVGTFVGCDKPSGNDTSSVKGPPADSENLETQTNEDANSEEENATLPAKKDENASSIANESTTDVKRQPEEMPEQKTVVLEPEPQPVSWLQRIRYWDIASRTIAERNETPADFDEAELKEFAAALEQAMALHKRMHWLYQSLQSRTGLANASFVSQWMLESLRGGEALPEGTRNRRKKLKALEQILEIEVRNNTLTDLEERLLEDRLRKGDLFHFAIVLRGNLIEFAAMREHEIALDEFFLSFPTMRIRESKEYFRLYEDWDVPTAEVATARELWADVPAATSEWYKTLNPYSLADSHMFDQAGAELVADGFGVLENDEFKKLIVLADRLEEMGGGADPLLISPQIKELEPRERIVEASKKNLEAIGSADKEALVKLRETILEALSSDARRRVTTYSLEEDETLRLDNLLSRDSGEIHGTRFMIGLDQVIRTSVAPMPLLRRADPEHLKAYFLLRQTQRHAVLHTGATVYFGE